MTSEKALEAAWRTWKGEVTKDRAPVKSVREMAAIIEDVYAHPSETEESAVLAPATAVSDKAT